MAVAGGVHARRAVQRVHHETGIIGQNGLLQARQYQECAGVTGMVLTKLDGTAKGGVVIAVAQALHIPVKFIGVGEQIDDLMPFDAKSFAEALI